MNATRDSSISDELPALLARHAGEADGQTVWPKNSWDLVCKIGSLRWCIPKEYGGQDRSGTTLLHAYKRLAGAGLTSCFILSQHDRASPRIRDSANDFAVRVLLPR